MPDNETKKRSYMALAPLSALAAIFINPIACILIPLILFFIFRSSRPNVGKVALQTADLAFSIQLWIVLISLALLLGISLEIIVAADAESIMATATSVILVIFVASLLVATFNAIKGRGCTHFFSFKVAERVLKLTEKSAAEKESENSPK